MAVLKPEVDFNFKPIRDLIAIFPDLGGKLLLVFSERGKKRLLDAYLSGKELDFSGQRGFSSGSPKDKAGKRTVRGDLIKKGSQLVIRSYPVNLFEKGRGLRSGAREPGKYIITRKLKNDIQMRATSYVNEFEKGILNQELRKIGAN